MINFLEIKKEIQRYSNEFAYCLKKIISNTHNEYKFASCLLELEAPLYNEFDRFVDKETKRDFYYEICFIQHIMMALYSLKRNEANEIWFAYFYNGQKETFYERSVDYRHRKKASIEFYKQIKNN